MSCMRRLAIALTLCFSTTVVQTCWAQSLALRVVVSDADTGQPLPARLTLQASDSQEYFYFHSEHPEGSAVKYDKQNWINARSIERHTTISAHSAITSLPAGNYRLVVEHGKATIPFRQNLTIDRDQRIEVRLKRWIKPEEQGWYSGDTHVHRTIDELRNVILAEDLNVVLPLTNWVTHAERPPTSVDKNIADATRSGLITVDPLHLIWPQNTEYEIFSVGSRQHTLGALFVLGHQQQLTSGVPPWKKVIDAAQQQSSHVAFDMDKLDWPFAMLLPALVPGALYELANNHVWQTEFAFRQWNSPAPPYLAPPYGARSGGHREWLDYTHGMYYSLLNCGLRLPPSAGTANGVHPVPAGFGRVYVQVPGEFTYQKWMQGLTAGRSFVTTGPMLTATLDGQLPGSVFQATSQQPKALQLKLQVDSLEPLLYGELIVNGQAAEVLRPQNTKTEIEGVFRTQLVTSLTPVRSGWAAVKFWQQSSDGQVRFVHSAPWYFEVDQQPVQPLAVERRYLIERMSAEIERSRGVLSEAALAEYETGLDFYRSLVPYDDRTEVAATARPMVGKAEVTRWTNIFRAHRLTPEEIRAATGLPIEQATLPDGPAYGELAKGLRILPYPGGRHPRRGFLEGAVHPERETKVSIFPPWDNAGDAGYVVVDVPEAIFSNLGLTYLAHKHIPTIWDQQQVKLERLEWVDQGGQLTLKRRLPNGIQFASHVGIEGDAVQMRIALTNGTANKLTGLRVQVCTMLGGLLNFNHQEPLESITEGSMIAVRGRDTQRWLITSWQPNQRVWQNPPVPCIHSDPVFPDCDPGQSVEVRGFVRFYEGEDVRAFMSRLP